ncbi:MAG TPA: hypothetical protein VFZ28_14830 [Burkholderiaceae bacterium]|nr:hypothetical protein [Burkholderiaceae bacterium]
MGRRNKLAVAALFASLVAASCGGGEEDDGTRRRLPEPPPQPVPGTPAKGRFVDAAVQGLSYTCGAASGLTSVSGEFDFLVGQRCSFGVGGIGLGAATADLTLTPVALVLGAVDETHPTVNNMARLLLSLVGDGDPGNGIEITDDVRNALAGATLNLAATTSAFETAAQALLSTAMPGRTLIDAVQAAAHLKATLLTRFDGHYDCGYVGSGSGAITADIDSGVIAGSGTEDESSAAFQVSGALQSSASVAIGSSANSGVTFSGTFYASGVGNGTYADSAGSGVWQCVRA